jgi:hypothetical protein
MAHTSPHEADHEQGRDGIPHQIADRPLPTPDAVLLDTDVAERRCWRCLKMFPGDPTRAPTPTPEWWLCDPCDGILLPAKQRAA